jgi:putative endonuclease
VDSSVIIINMQAKTNDTTTTRGREAEERAARYLESRGQQVISRNFRIRGGEIDLICRDGKALVLLKSASEVAATSAAPGPASPPASAAALCWPPNYLLGKPDCDCRFDCILIDGDQLEWIKHAFSADD